MRNRGPGNPSESAAGASAGPGGTFGFAKSPGTRRHLDLWGPAEPFRRRPQNTRDPVTPFRRWNLLRVPFHRGPGEPFSAKTVRGRKGLTGSRMEEKGLPGVGRDPVTLFERAHRGQDCEKGPHGTSGRVANRDPVRPFVCENRSRDAAGPFACLPQSGTR